VTCILHLQQNPREHDDLCQISKLLLAAIGSGGLWENPILYIFACLLWYLLSAPFNRSQSFYLSFLDPCVLFQLLTVTPDYSASFLFPSPSFANSSSPGSFNTVLVSVLPISLVDQQQLPLTLLGPRPFLYALYILMLLSF